MMNKIFLLFISLTLLNSCSEKATDETDISFAREQLGSLKTDSAQTSLGEVPYQRPYELMVEVKNNGVLTARNITPIEDNEENPVFYYTGEDYPGEAGTCGTTIAPGESCFLHFTFFTDDAGYFQKIFQYKYHDGETSLTKDITLSALAGAPAQFEFVDSISGLYNYGAQDVSSTSFLSKTITLKNIGDLSAKNIEIRLKGVTAHDDDVFKFVGGSAPGIGGTCGVQLSGGQSCTLVIEHKAKFLDATHVSNIQIDFDNPIVREYTSGAVKILGIEDRAFIVVTPANKNFSNIVNTSTDSEITWTYNNVGSRTASTINLVDEGEIGLELLSTDCPATLAPAAFCDATYRLKPNFDPAIDGKSFPRYSTEYPERYPIKLTYDDGKNAGTAEYTDFNIVYSVVGEALLTMREDGQITDPIIEGHIWDKNEWFHTVGNTTAKRHTITFQNGFSTTSRTYIPFNTFKVEITPDDGLLVLDTDFRRSNGSVFNPLNENIESNDKLSIGLSYTSNLDDITYPYLDAVNKIREYNIKVTYDNQVINKEVNFKVQTQDIIEPIVSFAVLNIKTPDDPDTIADETQYQVDGVTPTRIDSNVASESGINKVLSADSVYTNEEAQSNTIRIYNCGLAPISPIVEKIASGDSTHFSFEKVGTTCDDPIKSDGTNCDLTTVAGTPGTFCDIKLKFLKNTEPQGGDIEQISGTPGDIGDKLTSVFEFKDGFDQGDGDDSDKELHLQFDIVQREKGTLTQNLDHIADSTSDFTGDFKIIDMLYSGETDRTVSGVTKRLHFKKTGYGEINDLKCTVEGADQAYFDCDIVELDSSAFSTYAEGVNDVSGPYDSIKHAKYYANMSFKLDGTTTMRTYNASAKLEYHSKTEGPTDPYDPSDVLSIPLTAKVQGEPEFNFTTTAPYVIGAFMIEETMAPIEIEVVNIGGGQATQPNNVTIDYPTDLFEYNSFDASDPKCSFIGHVLGTITFNADQNGICKFSLTPVFNGPLENIVDDDTTENLLKIKMQYSKSYNTNSRELEFTANRLPAFTLSDTVLPIGDLKVGEIKNHSLTINTFLGKPTRDIENGTGTPYTLTLSSNGDNQVELLNATSTATCDIITTNASNIVFHTLTTGQTNCTFDISFTGKSNNSIQSIDGIPNPGGGLGTTYPKSFQLHLEYSTSYETFLQEILLENDQTKILNPLSSTDLIFAAQYLGDTEELEFSITHDAEIATNETAYYTGPITLSFNSDINALGTNELSWVTAGQGAGCSLVNEATSQITYNAAKDSVCKFKSKLSQTVFSPASFGDKSFIDLQVSINGFMNSISYNTDTSVKYRNSLEFFPDPNKVLLPAGTTGQIKTYDFTVLSRASRNTQDIKEIPNPATTIEKVIVKVSDTANYTIDWKDGVIDPDCSLDEKTGTQIKFHINAGTQCDFTLSFTVPGIGERQNFVIIEHVGVEQSRKEITGTGINYADLDIDLEIESGKTHLDIGEALANSETTYLDFILSNIETAAADGILKSVPEMTLTSCPAPLEADLPPEYIDNPLRIESDVSVFSVTPTAGTDACTSELALEDDATNSCGFTVNFTPLKVDRVYYACLTYKYARFPGEPMADWVTETIPLVGHSKSPELQFAGYSEVKAEGTYSTTPGFIELSWPAMTITGGVIKSYNIFRVPHSVGVFDTTPLLNQTATTLKHIIGDLAESTTYNYKLEAIVEFSAEPGVLLTKKTNINSKVTITLPEENQIYDHASKLVVERFESGGAGGAGQTFQTQAEAKTFCSDRTVAGQSMRLVNFSEFQDLSNINGVENLTDKNWEYIDQTLVVNTVDGTSLPVLPFIVQQLDLEADDIFDDLDTVFDYNPEKTIAACKIDGYTGPFPNRMLLAGGSDNSLTELNLNPSITTQLWCNPGYETWFDASGVNYPKGAARCIATVP